MPFVRAAARLLEERQRPTMAHSTSEEGDRTIVGPFVGAERDRSFGARRRRTGRTWASAEQLAVRPRIEERNGVETPCLANVALRVGDERVRDPARIVPRRSRNQELALEVDVEMRGERACPLLELGEAQRAPLDRVHDGLRDIPRLFRHVAVRLAVPDPCPSYDLRPSPPTRARPRDVPDPDREISWPEGEHGRHIGRREAPHPPKSRACATASQFVRVSHSRAFTAWIVPRNPRSRRTAKHRHGGADRAGVLSGDPARSAGARHECRPHVVRATAADTHERCRRSAATTTTGAAASACATIATLCAVAAVVLLGRFAVRAAITARATGAASSARSATPSCPSGRGRDRRCRQRDRGIDRHHTEGATASASAFTTRAATSASSATAARGAVRIAVDAPAASSSAAAPSAAVTTDAAGRSVRDDVARSRERAGGDPCRAANTSRPRKPHIATAPRRARVRIVRMRIGRIRRCRVCRDAPIPAPSNPSGAGGALN
jgi:hypothetical protein